MKRRPSSGTTSTEVDRQLDNTAYDNVVVVKNAIIDVGIVADSIVSGDVATLVGSDINIGTVAASIGSVDTVAASIADVTSAVNTIVPNITEILLADTNASTATTQAGIATAKAGEASTSASNALISETNADTSELMASKWASETTDVVVADGKYSSKHYAQKASEILTVGATLLINTPSGNISSTNVQAAINELDSEKQPIDTTLTALAGVVTATDKLIYATASDTFNTTTLTSFGRGLIDDVDASAGRTTLDISATNTPSIAVGGISATNVQSAIQELDTEKVTANAVIVAGTATKVTYDAKGLVTSGTTLSATDIPSLDANKITTGTIDPARLPSYVDDVLEYTNLAGFPVTGETGKIYISIATSRTYRWSGTVYVDITGNVDSVNGETGSVVISAGDIGSTAVGTISATNVQAALQELDTEKVPLNSDFTLDLGGL